MKLRRGTDVEDRWVLIGPRRPYCKECPPTCDYRGDCPDRDPDSIARCKAMADALVSGKRRVMSGDEFKAEIERYHPGLLAEMKAHPEVPEEDEESFDA